MITITDYITSMCWRFNKHRNKFSLFFRKKIEEPIKARQAKKYIRSTKIDQLIRDTCSMIISISGLFDNSVNSVLKKLPYIERIFRIENGNGSVTVGISAHYKDDTYEYRVDAEVSGFSLPVAGFAGPDKVSYAVTLTTLETKVTSGYNFTIQNGVVTPRQTAMIANLANSVFRTCIEESIPIVAKMMMNLIDNVKEDIYVQI